MRFDSRQMESFLRSNLKQLKYLPTFHRFLWPKRLYRRWLGSNTPCCSRQTVLRHLGKFSLSPSCHWTASDWRDCRRWHRRIYASAAYSSRESGRPIVSLHSRRFERVDPRLWFDWVRWIDTIAFRGDLLPYLMPRAAICQAENARAFAVSVADRSSNRWIERCTFWRVEDSSLDTRPPFVRTEYRFYFESFGASHPPNRVCTNDCRRPRCRPRSADRAAHRRSTLNCTTKVVEYWAMGDDKRYFGR